MKKKVWCRGCVVCVWNGVEGNDLRYLGCLGGHGRDGFEAQVEWNTRGFDWEVPDSSKLSAWVPSCGGTQVPTANQ